MKKYEVKGWVMLFLFLFTLLWMTSCKTKEVSTTKEKAKTELSVFQDLKFDHNGAVSVNNYEAERRERLLMDWVSNLQLDFVGQSEADKLIFELQQTIDGMKLQVSGTGTANYQQTESINIEQIETNLIKRIDSLFNQSLNSLLNQNERYLNEYFSKEKEVKSTGFTFGMYVIIALAVLLGIFLYWIGQKLKIKNLLNLFNIF